MAFAINFGVFTQLANARPPIMHHLSSLDFSIKRRTVSENKFSCLLSHSLHLILKWDSSLIFDFI